MTPLKKRHAPSDTMLRALVRQAIRKSQVGFINVQEAEELLRVFLKLVGREAMVQGRVMVPGFGVFYERTFKARRILNPVTGVPMEVAAARSLGFRAARAMKESADEG